MQQTEATNSARYMKQYLEPRHGPRVQRLSHLTQGSQAQLDFRVNAAYKSDIPVASYAGLLGLDAQWPYAHPLLTDRDRPCVMIIKIPPDGLGNRHQRAGKQLAQQPHLSPAASSESSATKQ